MELGRMRGGKPMPDNDQTYEGNTRRDATKWPDKTSTHKWVAEVRRRKQAAVEAGERRDTNILHQSDQPHKIEAKADRRRKTTTNPNRG
jgi:hypothetical protein